eukprot:3560124-Alexandrium_andersonii.AAC.1
MTSKTPCPPMRWATTRAKSTSEASGLPWTHTGPVGSSKRTATRPGPAGAHSAWPATEGGGSGRRGRGRADR